MLSAFEEKLRLGAASPSDQFANRNQQLSDLLNHARSHVPFWRDRIRHPVTPDDARDVMAGLPIMERANIQSDRSDFLSDVSDNAIDDATGGSSGTPMRFKVDRATQIARESSLYWSDSLAGWRYGERIAMLWGSDKDVKTAGQAFRSKLRWWMDNRHWYNAFHMGEDRMAQFHASMSRFRPHIIVAYAGSLEIFARYLESQSTHPPNYPVNSLISSAEVLTPKARETIERVFGKPVFNRYGNREFGALAAEDGNGDSLFINPTDCILEVDSEDPENIAGPLLVTYLVNRAMPFIRYNTGDLARMSVDGTRLLSLAGRESDTIRTKRGSLIHGEFFTHLMYRASNVREFQFVQEEPNRYRLLLVAEKEESPDIIESIRKDILEEVGNDAVVAYEYVKDIPVLASGKRKFTLSFAHNPKPDPTP